MYQCCEKGGKRCCRSPWMRSIQIFLLLLIALGLGLLATQKLWVPPLVNYLLQQEMK